MLLPIPIQKQVVTGRQQWIEQLTQFEVGLRRRNPSIHDFEVATDLPLGNLCNTAIVGDNLGLKESQELGKDTIEVGRMDGLFQDEMTLLGELLTENASGNFGWEAVSEEIWTTG